MTGITTISRPTDLRNRRSGCDGFGRGHPAYKGGVHGTHEPRRMLRSHTETPSRSSNARRVLVRYGTSSELGAEHIAA